MDNKIKEIKELLQEFSNVLWDKVDGFGENAELRLIKDIHEEFANKIFILTNSKETWDDVYKSWKWNPDIGDMDEVNVYDTFKEYVKNNYHPPIKKLK